MHTRQEKLEKFGRLLDIMDRLREQCPWNHAQTVDTLRPMTAEEVYELSDAVINHDEDELKKELGDVLLHIVFYSKIAQEQGKYDIGDVLDRICEKMVFRHPHVFSDTTAADAKTGYGSRLTAPGRGSIGSLAFQIAFAGKRRRRTRTAELSVKTKRLFPLRSS